jgi:putative DNA-invertase from lambdoid prophage Rac
VTTVLYARVSKGEDQDPETQLLELREWARRTGVVAEEFVDEISSRDRRPRKEEVLRRVRLGLLDRVVVVRLDRWGRSMDELVLELEEFSRRKVELVSLREGLRFDDATGRLLAHVLAAFANFERDLVKERTIAGLRRAAAQGKIGGRHPKDCGCGLRPVGRPPHVGSVKPIRQEGRAAGWQREKPPAPEGAAAPTEGVGPEQTGVSEQP